MARIRSKAALVEYIKSQLGAPLINIEVTDPQIEQIIDDSIQKFTEYAYGTLEDVVLVQINGAGDYPLPDTITNIVAVSQGTSASSAMDFAGNFGQGYVPNIWSEQYFSGGSAFMGNMVQTIISISAVRTSLERYFRDEIAYNFNHISKTLQVHENYNGTAAIHYQYEYLANDEDDLVFNHEWIKAYTVSKTKMLWGTVTGKFDQALVGGARINYADMKSEAQQEIEILNEQLLTKWSDPAPIDVS